MLTTRRRLASASLFFATGSSSAIRIAYSISSSGVSSGTRPISLRYTLTGSSIAALSFVATVSAASVSFGKSTSRVIPSSASAEKSSTMLIFEPSSKSFSFSSSSTSRSSSTIRLSISCAVRCPTDFPFSTSFLKALFFFSSDTGCVGERLILSIIFSSFYVFPKAFLNSSSFISEADLLNFLSYSSEITFIQSENSSLESVLSFPLARMPEYLPHSSAVSLSPKLVISVSAPFAIFSQIRPNSFLIKPPERLSALKSPRSLKQSGYLISR